MLNVVLTKIQPFFFNEYSLHCCSLLDNYQSSEKVSLTFFFFLVCHFSWVFFVQEKNFDTYAIISVAITHQTVFNSSCTILYCYDQCMINSQCSHSLTNTFVWLSFCFSYSSRCVVVFLSFEFVLKPNQSHVYFLYIYLPYMYHL